MGNAVSIDRFKAVSVRGRMAYGAMCAEEYILNMRPEQDWLAIFKKIWNFNEAEYWDDWRDETIDILPECFLDDAKRPVPLASIPILLQNQYGLNDSTTQRESGKDACGYRNMAI